jgi:hypothetical protein
MTADHRIPGYSQADRAVLKVLTGRLLETNKALRDLARIAWSVASSIGNPLTTRRLTSRKSGGNGITPALSDMHPAMLWQQKLTERAGHDVSRL